MVWARWSKGYGASWKGDSRTASKQHTRRKNKQNEHTSVADTSEDVVASLRQQKAEYQRLLMATQDPAVRTHLQGRLNDLVKELDMEKHIGTRVAAAQKEVRRLQMRVERNQAFVARAQDSLNVAQELHLAAEGELEALLAQQAAQ